MNLLLVIQSSILIKQNCGLDHKCLCVRSVAETTNGHEFCETIASKYNNAHVMQYINRKYLETVVVTSDAHIHYF